MSRQSPFHRLWIVLLFAACLTRAHAQALTQRNVDPRAFDATQFGERVTLGPEWLFSPGDTPAFAEPNFDDRQWLKLEPALAIWVFQLLLGFAAFHAPILITNIVLLALLVRALRAGNREARILLPAVLLEGFYQ